MLDVSHVTKKYGKVAAIAMVDEDEDLILIASDGIIIRIPAGSISTFARPSKGVRVMRVNEGEKLATMVVVAHEDADKDDESDETGEAGEETDASAETADETEE